MVLDPGSVYADADPMRPYYRDGRPVSVHTGYSNQCVSGAHARDGIPRVMRFTDQFAWQNSSGVPGTYQGGPKVNGFRLDRNVWDPESTWQDSPIFGTIYLAVAKDPRTEDVYLAADYDMRKWVAATGSYEQLPLNPRAGTSPGANPSALLNWASYPSLVDATRNRLVALHDGEPYYDVGTIRLQIVDLGTGNVSTLRLSGAYPKTIPGVSQIQGCGITHDLDNDRYLVVQGTNVYAIDPTSGASSLIATTPAQPNGAYNRFEYFPALGGVAYLPSFGSNVYFMPTR
jgi:hypothetical protein